MKRIILREKEINERLEKSKREELEKRRERFKKEDIAPKIFDFTYDRMAKLDTKLKELGIKRKVNYYNPPFDMKSGGSGTYKFVPLLDSGWAVYERRYGEMKDVLIGEATDINDARKVAKGREEKVKKHNRSLKPIIEKRKYPPA